MLQFQLLDALFQFEELKANDDEILIIWVYLQEFRHHSFSVRYIQFLRTLSLEHFVLAFLF
jgi:hypothetical protein